ncbi:MAG TPA: hypothetical protein PLO37_23585 [Candidatus Hydrogenedentes bacterium]|nr:hypothetical protein [Candidatus Hydrogenedentota bacterium]HPG69843.1 hypothetical protein [Candidatus Hydrogenedentota bacterium]
MIHVDPVPEPAAFDADVRQVGNAWLGKHPTGQPPSLWRDFSAALAEGFHDLCGYGAMYEPRGTIDHFISIKEARCLAYEWNNYRYASQWINSSKQQGRSGACRVLDPYEVQHDWFEVLLPSLQMTVTDRIPSDLRARAEYTLDRLHLRDDERILRQRQHWMKEYEKTGDIGILERNAPLLARAVLKRQRPATPAGR